LKSWKDLVNPALAVSQVSYDIDLRVMRALKAGMTQKKIAEFLDVSPSYIHQITKRLKRRQRFWWREEKGWLKESPIESYMAEKFNGPKPEEYAWEGTKEKFTESIHQWVRFFNRGGFGMS
jgi:hypothetical protein